jgi:two-component system chemotaxis sensor kinase CheA
MKKPGASGIDFAAEAAERIEAIRSVLEIGREPKITEINEIFRAAHSLKGLAGLGGFDRFGKALHEAENLLDSIRLSRMPWSPRIADALARFLEGFETSLHAAARTGNDEAFPLEKMLRLLDSARTTAVEGHTRPLSEDLDLPPESLSCLSEYEESRLRANIGSGMAIFAVDASFDLDTFESALKQVGARLNETGEWIATLPQVAGFTADRLAFQLLASAPDEPSGLPEGISARRVSRQRAVPVEVMESIRAASSKTVRLDSERLDRLLSEVEESRASYQKLAFELAHVEAELPPLRRVRLARLRERLGASVVRLTRQASAARTVPVSNLGARLQRAAVRLLETSGKMAAFTIEGGDVEIDRDLAEDLADPLLHLLRNSIDHGIEPPAQRRAAGKPEEARITLAARTRGSRLSISIVDDGRGIAEEQVLARARGLGWVKPTEIPSREDLYDFLFRPGFTTAAAVSQLSGRGVGLDVVAQRVAERHGEVHVDSEPGKGARFHLVVPVAQAVFDALIVEEEKKLYAFPLASIARVEREVPGAPPATAALGAAMGGRAPSSQTGRMRLVLPDARTISVAAVLRQAVLVVRPIGAAVSTPFLIGASEGEGDEAILVIDPRPLLRRVEPGRAS